MPDLTRSIAQIVNFLRSRCGLHEIKVDPRLMPVSFDAILVGSDPLTIVAVEQKRRVGSSFLYEIVRKAQSFVWSAYTNNKLALLNLVVLLPDPLTPEQVTTLEKQLSGTARVFIVTEDMPIDEVEARLSLLASPRLAPTDSVAGVGDTVATLLGGVDAQFYEELTKRSASVDELTKRITERFRSLISEVTRATENA